MISTLVPDEYRKRLGLVTAGAVPPEPAPEVSKQRGGGVLMARDVLARLVARGLTMEGSGDHCTYGPHGPALDIPVGLTDTGPNGQSHQLVVRLGGLTGVPVGRAREASRDHVPQIRMIVVQSGMPVPSTDQPEQRPTLAVSLLFLTGSQNPVLHAANLAPGWPTFMVRTPQAGTSYMDCVQTNAFPPGSWMATETVVPALSLESLLHLRRELLTQIAALPEDEG